MVGGMVFRFSLARRVWSSFTGAEAQVNSPSTVVEWISSKVWFQPFPKFGTICAGVHYTFFFPSRLISAPFFSLYLLVVTQIRGHIAGSPPPYPLRFVPCTFIARRLQPFLPSSTPSNCAYPCYRQSQQLIPFFVFADKNSKSHHGGIRTPDQRYE